MTVQTVSNQTDQTVSKKSKSWYKRKRFWFFVILVLLVYFCLVPSPSRISVETTGFNEPLTADGQVDYFGIFEKMYIDKLSSPEDNGKRLIIAAFGPRALERSHLAETFQWEEIPTHKDSKDWFENNWIPLCEHLYIDPYQKPMFYNKIGFFAYMNKHFKKQEDKTAPNESTTNRTDKTYELFNKLTSASWKREDYPEVGKWLDEYSEVLDYFGMCVRKTNFVSWRQRPENGHLWEIVLPDIQVSRDYARSLQVRITERIGRGDIDGAFYDVMSMKHLASHNIQETTLVANLVGIAVNSVANNSMKKILTNCPLTEEQLAKFKNELDSLPKYNSIASCLLFERAMLFHFLHFFKNEKITEEDIEAFMRNDRMGVMRLIFMRLPFDVNIAGKHLAKLCNESNLQGSNHIFNNPALRQKYVTHWENLIQKTHNNTTSIKRLYQIPLIRTRSKLVAETIFANFTSAVESAFLAFDRCDAENTMLSIVMSLESYKLANGKYPENLETLVPKYLDMMPIDPCTGRTTFVYKLRETSTKTTTEETPKPKELPYILYSLGPNAKDDGGIPIGQKGQKFNEYDLVF